MESITIYAGLKLVNVVLDGFDARLGSHEQFASEAIPIRLLRSFICSADSSPETYSTLPERALKLLATCISSVDLPMPGSPPIRTNDPATTPPPSTRSNSEMPLEVRVAPAADRSVIGVGGAKSPELADRAPGFFDLDDLFHHRGPLTAVGASPNPLGGFVRARLADKLGVSLPWSLQGDPGTENKR